MIHHPHDTSPEPAKCLEEVEIRGHIIDSLILPKMLDCISAGGGAFRIKQIAIGQARNDPSYALVEVQRRRRRSPGRILGQIADHGAMPTTRTTASLCRPTSPAPFPKDFTAPPTSGPRCAWSGKWIPVADQEMDCGIVFDPAAGAARCLPMNEVRIGDPIVVGHAGVRVFPEERRRGPQTFEFMDSNVSTEKPKGVAIREIAHELVREPRRRRPDAVGRRAGHRPHRQRRVSASSSARATSTCSLPAMPWPPTISSRPSSAPAWECISTAAGWPKRVTNTISAPSTVFDAAAESATRSKVGVLTTGIMYECVRQGVDFLLAGSIRDDGPLPEVITDVLEAQQRCARRSAA